MTSYGFFQSLVAFPKLKRQLLLCHPEVQSPREFTENTVFAVNQDFSLMFVLFITFRKYKTKKYK